MTSTDIPMVKIRLRDVKGIPPDHSRRSEVLTAPGRKYIPDGTTEAAPMKMLIEYKQGVAQDVPQEDADVLLGLSSDTKTREGARVSIPWFELVGDDEAYEALPPEQKFAAQLASQQSELDQLKALVRQAGLAPQEDVPAPVEAAGETLSLDDLSLGEVPQSRPAGVSSDLLTGGKRGPGRPRRE
jgi:hypothetical protein